MQELAHRYASQEMRDLWSENHKIYVWRQLWVTLAEAQRDSGLTRIRFDQIDSLRKHIGSFREDPRQSASLAKLEEECKHDIVAHIRLYGELCPGAKDIIHLGATSCDITDNADLIIIRSGLNILRKCLVGVIDSLGALAEIYKDVPCLAYTHYQPAQLTTVGKRICLWANDFVDDFNKLDSQIRNLKFRGMKGATGTQDSFLKLLGDPTKVAAMESYVAKRFSFTKVHKITGQTYSRKVDSNILSVLSGIGQTAHKFGSDMRLLQHDYELQEPFGAKQVGSSAMPFKRNPMRAERLCSLSRYLVNECHNAENTAMTQWLERTLDDSAGRRIYLPASFYACEAVLRLVLYIANGIHVNKDVIESRVKRELPFVLMEPLLIEAVKLGGDRQFLHQQLRDACQEAANMVHAGRPNTLWTDLEKNSFFKIAIQKLDREPKNYVGMTIEQVEQFVADVITPIREQNKEFLGQYVDLKV